MDSSLEWTRGPQNQTMVSKLKEEVISNWAWCRLNHRSLQILLKCVYFINRLIFMADPRRTRTRGSAGFLLVFPSSVVVMREMKTQRDNEASADVTGGC